MAELESNSFRTIVEQCAIGIVIQCEERVVYANRAASDCLGFASPADLRGRPLRDLLEAESYATLACNFTKVTPVDDQLFMGDLKLLRRLGDPIDAEVYHAGIRFDGADATMINFRDVTITKRMELDLRQSQKLESIGRLAAGVAHEINTPIQYIGDSAHYLAGAIGELLDLLDKSRAKLRELVAPQGDSAALEALSAEEESADLEYARAHAPQSIERIIDGVSRVARIVSAMKSFSHPGTTAPVPMDVNRMVADTLAVAAHELRTASLVRTEYGDFPQIAGYPGDLNQALLNLVVNAAHAIADRKETTLPGIVTVRTSCDGGHVEIRVEDNGCGMTPDVQARLFEPFFTTKEIGRGSGQGLSVVRAAVIQKHNGTIHIDTKAGEGTTFVLRLPITQPP